MRAYEPAVVSGHPERASVDRIPAAPWIAADRRHQLPSG